jgi:hypothetical protein
LRSPRDKKEGGPEKEAAKRRRKEEPTGGMVSGNLNSSKPQEFEMAMSSTNGKSSGDVRGEVINNGVKLIGEIVLPGASELLEGRIGKGATAAGIGLLVPALSVSMFGPIPAIILGAGAALGARLWSYTDSLYPEKSWSFGQKTALDRLDDQFAEGKVSSEEYKQRRQVLLNRD